MYGSGDLDLGALSASMETESIVVDGMVPRRSGSKQY